MQMQRECIALSRVKTQYKKMVLLRCFAPPMAAKRFRSKLQPLRKGWGGGAPFKERDSQMPLRTEA